MSIKELKVLNIAQPHAHAVIYKGKNVENRTKSANFRGTIAIYGSKTLNKRRFEGQDLIKPEDCDFGCIIGLVDLVDCIDETEVTDQTKEWFMGPYGYVLTNIIALKEPVKVMPPQGAVIWWPLQGEGLQKVLSQVEVSKIKGIENVSKEELDARNKARILARPIPSPELSEIVGDEPMTVFEALDLIIDYIEEYELFEQKEDGNDLVLPDEKLKKIFGKSEVYASEVKDLLSLHLIKQAG